jgi:transcriptional regulator with XRE-family HTH domain
MVLYVGVPVSAQTIVYIEGGRTWASDKILVRLAEILDADVSQFFSPNLSEIITDDTQQRQSISELKKELLTYIDARFALLR